MVIVGWYIEVDDVLLDNGGSLDKSGWFVVEV